MLDRAPQLNSVSLIYLMNFQYPFGNTNLLRLVSPKIRQIYNFHQIGPIWGKCRLYEEREAKLLTDRVDDLI